VTTPHFSFSFFLEDVKYGFGISGRDGLSKSVQRLSGPGGAKKEFG